MKIVQVSTNTIPVPPKDYGGTQRIVYYLTEELMRRGHQVILFAKKGSKVNASKIYEYTTNNPAKQLQFIKRNLPKDADFIHDHYGIVAKANPPVPTIRHSHSKGITGVQIPVYVSKMILRKYGRGKGHYIHNGIRLKDYTYRSKKSGYLLFLGRLIEDKGAHLAIKIAQQTGKPLIIAGNMPDKRYFNTKIKPHLNSRIRYVGPVGGTRKLDLLSRASCVLFTSTWDEPFGLVLVEALASGTPVLGFRKGAVAEVLRGMPQLLCSSTGQMIQKVRKQRYPSPERCRAYVQTHFSDRAMTDKFLKLYSSIISKGAYKTDLANAWRRV